MPHSQYYEKGKLSGITHHKPGEFDSHDAVTSKRRHCTHNLSHDYTCKLIKILFQKNKRAPSRRREFSPLIGTFQEVFLSVGGMEGGHGEAEF